MLNCADCGPQPEENFYIRKPYKLAYCKGCHVKRSIVSVMKLRALNESEGRPRTFKRRLLALEEEKESSKRLRDLEDRQARFSHPEFLSDEPDPFPKETSFSTIIGALHKQPSAKQSKNGIKSLGK